MEQEPRVRTFPVIEVFGPTVQGEGALAGAVTHFIRFGGCDFRCSWCDSLYAVLPEQVRANATKLNSDEILDVLQRLGGDADWVTLSGGNPAMLELGPLVGQLHGRGYKVAVETQGSMWKEWLLDVDCLTVSPKPPSSGMADKTEELLPAFMQSASPPSNADALKIVVFDDTDFEWAVRVLKEHHQWPAFLSCGTDPPAEGESRLATIDRVCSRYRWLCEKVVEEKALSDVRVLPQLHVLSWGHSRGV